MTVVPSALWEEIRRKEIAGPYVVWTDFGCEGWKPESFQTLKEAIEAPRYGSPIVIMKPVAFTVTDSDAR